MRFDSSVGIGKTCSDKSMHGTLYLFECGLELDIPVFYPMKMLLLNHVNTNLKLPVLNSPYIWFDSNNTYEKYWTYSCSGYLLTSVLCFIDLEKGNPLS